MEDISRGRCGGSPSGGSQPRGPFLYLKKSTEAGKPENDAKSQSAVTHQSIDYVKAAFGEARAAQRSLGGFREGRRLSAKLVTNFHYSSPQMKYSTTRTGVVK